MARVLLGWELGAGSGHAVKLKGIAAELRARGHEPIFALHQIGSLKVREEIWQAPLWPGQLVTLARQPIVTPATIGDILVVMGVGEQPAIAAMLIAWERILRTVKPDAVIAEFAPGLTLTARGRWPLLAVGTGFSLPPSQHPRFPSLTGKPTVFDEGAVLGLINGALGEAGLPRLNAYPEIFATDLRIPAVFRELDPYREWRRDRLGVPSLSGAVEAFAGSGEEVFFYMNGAKPLPEAFWQGIVDSRLPARIYAPGVNESDCRVLEGVGLTVERKPVPLDTIVERSRFVVSHGGLGFASSMLLAGMPHVFVPFDIEKRMIAASVETLGSGARQEFSTISADGVARLLQAAYADETMRRNALAMAPDFRSRMTTTCEIETVDALETLLP